MKVIYVLIFIGAIALFFLFFWVGHPEMMTGSPSRGSVAWYRQHPRQLAAENIKCWKLLQQASFADVDKVMAAHPECHVAYEASQNSD